MSLLRGTILFAVMWTSSYSFASNHNLTSQAFGSAIGLFNLEYSYKVSDYCTLGITGLQGVGHLGPLDIEGSAYGLMLRRYFRPALENDSPYFLLTVQKTDYDFTVKDNDKNYFAKSEKWIASTGLGYHWFWQSFNISFGLLVSSDQNPIELKTTSGEVYKDSLNPGVGLDFTIGGKF